MDTKQSLPQSSKVTISNIGNVKLELCSEDISHTILRYNYGQSDPEVLFNSFSKGVCMFGFTCSAFTDVHVAKYDSDICSREHISWGNTFHCNTGHMQTQQVSSL